MTQLVETIGGTKHTTVYSYDSGNRVNYIVNGNVEEGTSYDAYGRLSRRDVYDVESWEITDGFTNVITYDYTYTTGTDTTVQSNYLKALTYETPWISGSVNYSYDNNGNISQYVSAWDGGSSTIGYVYDSANQLIRENNSGMGSTWVWTYDNAGNILTSKKYSYTTATDLSGLTPLESHTYTYGDADWGDLLTAYDGTAITYDGIGNPLSDGTWTYTWEHGRQLKSMSNGSTTWNYTYDASGMRQSRTNGSSTYTYVYNGDQLTQMTKGSDTLYFTYGSTGPVSVTWNGTTYYYVVNAQGDVIGIMEHTGDLAVEYRYNAWGEVTYSGYEPELAQLNPLRYRGYVYDTETGLYYLQSRYYNPKLSRFLNADAFASTGQGLLGNNMFIYCNNNPVNRVDYYGYMSRFNQISAYDSIKPIGSYAYEMYKKLEDSYSAAGITLYSTEWSALMDWRNTYLPLSTEYEHAAYLYSVETTLGTRFYFSNTNRGSKGNSIMSPNVIIPTLILEASNCFAGGNLVAQVHTHPMSSKGYHNDFPSYSPNVYGGDRLAYELFGYPEMYIIPYTRCSHTSMIVAISNRSTWCVGNPYR